MYHRISLGHNIGRWVYAYNLKDAYALFHKEMIRVTTALSKKAEYQMEFAFFSEKQLLLSTADYNSDITHVMVGRAIEMRAMQFPHELIEEGMKETYKTRYFVL